jgi:hypothetical protein
MAKSNRLKTKPGPRRSNGNGVPIVVRMHDPLLSEIDQWIGESALSRPEAVRQLLWWALIQANKRIVKRTT